MTGAIYISGPTGTGKSTVSRMLATALGAQLVPEPIPKAMRLLGAPDQGERTAYAAQKEILESKVQWFKLLDPERLVILDRIVAEDREVFFQLHRRLDRLTASEHADLIAKSLVAEQVCPPPTTVIFLFASEEVLRKRMIKGRRPGWLVQSLPMQLELYAQYVIRASIDVCIDTTGQSVQDVYATLLKMLTDRQVDTDRPPSSGPG